MVHEIPSMKDFAPEESQVLWWDAEDYDGIMNQCEVTVAKMENGESINDKNYSAAGLESWTKEGFQKRERHKEGAIDIVLDEQFAQWDDGADDEDSIAELYRARSFDAKMVAMTKGLVMEREVQEYLVSTMENYDSVSTLSTLSVRSLLSQPKSTCSLLSMNDDSSVVSTKSSKSSKSIKSSKSSKSSKSFKSCKSSKSSKSSKASKSTKSKSSDSTTSRSPTKTKNKQSSKSIKITNSKSPDSTTTSPTKTKNKPGRLPKSPTKKCRQMSNEEAPRHYRRSV
jgi:hypothetical protein